MKNYVLGEISDSHGIEYEDCCLLGGFTVQTFTDESEVILKLCTDCEGLASTRHKSKLDSTAVLSYLKWNADPPGEKFCNILFYQNCLRKRIKYY